MKIPEIKIILNPETDEAKNSIGFKWAGEDSEGRIVGSRHKIGREPDWLQSDETPVCECGKKMSFYGQFDSLGDDICLGDCGIVYVFVCFECFTTQSIIQSY
jgi:hypothetical protein